MWETLAGINQVLSGRQARQAIDEARESCKVGRIPVEPEKKGFADRDLEISDMTNNIRFLIYNIRLIYNIIYFMVL
jgi:hypothetical protein